MYAKVYSKDQKSRAVANRGAKSGPPEPVQISISENEVKTAEVADTIKYPGVSSCITITLVLENGKKVGGHLALLLGSADELIERMNTARDGVAVTTILVKGHGTMWGTHLENTAQLAAKMAVDFYEENPDGNFESMPWTEHQAIQTSMSMDRNQGVFRHWIATQFGGGNVVYRFLHRDGDVYITADGRFA